MWPMLFCLEGFKFYKFGFKQGMTELHEGPCPVSWTCWPIYDPPEALMNLSIGLQLFDLLDTMIATQQSVFQKLGEPGWGSRLVTEAS